MLQRPYIVYDAMKQQHCTSPDIRKVHEALHAFSIGKLDPYLYWCGFQGTKHKQSPETLPSDKSRENVNAASRVSDRAATTCEIEDLWSAGTNRMSEGKIVGRRQVPRGNPKPRKRWIDLIGMQNRRYSGK